tara:strand:+ start:62 stop:325 length:264 start_codon:yes stop_codon:yes gene_type:complete
VANILNMNEDKKKELQSATFDRLLKHLDERKDVQNIDLMNLAGFCRNCLSKWLHEESEIKGIKISKEEAEEQVYGMSKVKWKEKYQK